MCKCLVILTSGQPQLVPLSRPPWDTPGPDRHSPSPNDHRPPASQLSSPLSVSELCLHEKAKPINIMPLWPANIRFIPYILNLMQCYNFWHVQGSIKICYTYLDSKFCWSQIKIFKFDKIFKKIINNMFLALKFCDAESWTFSN